MITNDMEPASDDDQLQRMSAKQLQAEIEKAIAELPPKRQEIFRLSREAGLSRKQIADKLDISENTVKNQLTSAVNTLQEILKDRNRVLLPAILFFAV